MPVAGESPLERHRAGVENHARKGVAIQLTRGVGDGLEVSEGDRGEARAASRLGDVGYRLGTRLGVTSPEEGRGPTGGQRIGGSAANSFGSTRDQHRVSRKVSLGFVDEVSLVSMKASLIEGGDHRGV